MSAHVAMPKEGAWVALPRVTALIGALLVLDALWLMTEGMLNVGVLLPLVLGATLLLLGLRWSQVQAWLSKRASRRHAWRAAWWLFAAWLVSLMVFWWVLARQSGDAPNQPAPAAIVVLGSGAPNGRPSPTLAARLDVALAQAARYPAVPVVVSGGIGFREPASEAKVMGDYLRAKGLAADRIVQEERSTSTFENLRFSSPLLAARGVSPSARIQLVTSDFHTLRARWIARRAGYRDVQAVGAPTPLYVRFNAWSREYFAVASSFVLREF